jgi:hypothetical protein
MTMPIGTSRILLAGLSALAGICLIAVDARAQAWAERNMNFAQARVKQSNPIGTKQSNPIGTKQSNPKAGKQRRRSP